MTLLEAHTAVARHNTGVVVDITVLDEARATIQLYGGDVALPIPATETMNIGQVILTISEDPTPRPTTKEDFYAGNSPL